MREALGHEADAVYQIGAAVAANAAAEVAVKLNGTPMTNGTAAAWNSGSNTLTVTVTAEDGTTVKTYTVTVTKQ